ncbi:unnamed protein product [Ectocarpus sp. CCAP 1310/34]|nr:unnamed protein product [Ectocarpus sp. CCAP 1310/34]
MATVPPLFVVRRVLHSPARG